MAALLEQVAAESGEGGYERLNIGFPRGYVEPNPLFFNKLSEGFKRIAKMFRDIKDDNLGKKISGRIEKTIEST